ncbi:MAG TPA: ABC transporter ATP-binding protein [Solirubrobacteraceae bacterium]|nr:ABC transporter ATP-binding protein [Solirubrobacteraceae bacterium]
MEVSELGKIYETRHGAVEAVRRANFAVERGEFVSLVGPSGCGKSTILHILAGLLDFDTGDVKMAGTPAKAGRRDVGIMLQRPVLFPWRTVLQNVLLPTQVFKIDRRGAQRAAVRERAADLLKLVGLEGFEEKYPWELSGGMQQRASLARLLVFEPEILLMDEPFAALDEFTRERLNSELARLHETLGRTVLYVTHNIQEAVFLSDRVVVMKPRPGEVLEIVDITLERPRRIEMIAEPETAALVARIRTRLGFDEDEEDSHGDG